MVAVLLISASSWGGAQTNAWQRQLLQGLSANRTSTNQAKQKSSLETKAVLDRICSASQDSEPDPRKQNPTQCMPIDQVLDEEGFHDNSLVAQQLNKHDDHCGAMLQMPKVALMFLTRGPMPHEELWNRWLASAAGLLAVDCASSSLCSQTPMNSSSNSTAQRQPSMSALKQACTLKRTAQNGYLQQHMFSIYIHPPPDYTGYDPSSVFYKRELPVSQRLVTKWGHHSTTEVTRRMIKAALEDPLNQRFVQLSESCIPLYPPGMVHQQLTLDPVSRIGACIKEGFDRNVNRWHWRMGTDDFWQSHWRKNSQWFMFIRKHANIVARDDYISDIFEKYCVFGNDVDGHFHGCLSDEHYLSTLLAYKGLEHETDCTGHITWDVWEWSEEHPNPAHPKEYAEWETNNDTLTLIRDHWDGHCKDHKLAMNSSEQLYAPISEVLSGSCKWQGAQYHFMRNDCPLFARKFKGETVKAMLSLAVQPEIRMLQQRPSPSNNTAWLCAANSTAHEPVIANTQQM